MEENNNLMQEMLDSYEGSFKTPRRNDVIEGKVVMVTDHEVVVNIGYKSDGIVHRDEINIEENESLQDKFEEGQVVDVFVLKTDGPDGNIICSMKKLAVDQEFKELEEIFEKGTIITVSARQVVKGGVIAFYKNVRGFIPASHISLRYENDLNKYVGQNLEVKIIEYDKKKKRAVFSRKELLKNELVEKKEDFFAKMHEGMIVEGIVKRLSNFGAFIDIGGFDGLVHITEITYGRIKNPSEQLKVNQKVMVKILSIDPENEKISLSIKQVSAHPWEEAIEKYAIGSVHEGRIVNTTSFGAFVELEPGIEGLVHISQIATERIDKPSDVLKENEVYEFQVLEIDPAEKKIKLSKKSLCVEDCAEEVAEAAETVEEFIENLDAPEKLVLLMQLK